MYIKELRREIDERLLFVVERLLFVVEKKSA
jgi:hypothetical protein